MKNLIFKSTHIVIVALFLFSCKKSTDKNLDFTKKKEAVLYSQDGYHDFMKLFLYKNNEFKFIKQVHHDLGYSETIGNYKLISNSLNLYPKKTKECAFEFVDDIEKAVCKDVKFEDIEFKIKTKFYLIKWNGFNYLLSDEPDQTIVNDSIDSDFLRFINYFNDGIEPSRHGRYLISKDSSDINKELNLQKFPEKYRELLKI